MKVTVLGLGAMGTRIADRLEAAGHQVVRWNRTGATATPRQAAESADVVIAIVRDDEASHAVWLGEDGALAGMGDGAVAIESSTLTVDWVKALAAAAQALGTEFLDAPVIGSRPQAEAGQLIYLIGGDAAVIDRVRPVLDAIGGSQLHAGPVGTGAALKLIANTLFGVQVAAVAELIGRMPSLGLDPAGAIELLGRTPLLSPAAKGAAGLMLAGRHEPLFPVALVAKDFRYAIADLPDRMPQAAGALDLFRRAERNGLGNANLTVVAKLF